MIRVANPGDRPALATLQSWLPERAPRLLAGGSAVGDVLVSTADGRPVGYLLAVGSAVGRGSDGPVDTTTTGSDGRPPTTGSAHVAELAVAPTHRREGRAGALLDRLLENHAHVTVLVAADNEPALACYRSRGFETVGRRPEAFDSGGALLLSTDGRAAGCG